MRRLASRVRRSCSRVLNALKARYIVNAAYTIRYFLSLDSSLAIASNLSLFISSFLYI